MYQIKVGERVWITEHQTINGMDYYYVYPIKVVALQGGRVRGRDQNGVPVSASLAVVYPTRSAALTLVPPDRVIDLFPTAEKSRLSLDEFRLALGDRYHGDDDVIRTELVGRGLWDRFLAARDAVTATPRYWGIATPADVFLGFDGFPDAPDNGFGWFRNLTPGEKASILSVCPDFGNPP